MLYRNIREFSINLFNSAIGKDFIVGPGQVIDLPEEFASFYSNVLKPVNPQFIPDSYRINQPIDKIESVEYIMSDIKQEEIKEVLVEPKIEDKVNEEVKEEIKEEITPPVKKGRGRPRK
jgi:hypothetical protein